MRDFLKGHVTPRDWMAVAGILGTTIAVTIAYVLFVHQKQEEKLAIITQNNVAVTQDLARANDINSRISALRTETQNIEILVSEFEQRLPSKRQIPAMLQEFEGMEGDFDIEIEFSPLERVLDERKETIPYNVIARGNFHNIGSFVNQLERNKRFLKITEIHVNTVKGGLVEAEFVMNTFRFIQKHTEGEEA